MNAMCFLDGGLCLEMCQLKATRAGRSPARRVNRAFTQERSHTVCADNACENFVNVT